jgi:hypothetical protein
MNGPSVMESDPVKAVDQSQPTLVPKQDTCMITRSQVRNTVVEASIWLGGYFTKYVTLRNISAHQFLATAHRYTTKGN